MARLRRGAIAAMVSGGTALVALPTAGTSTLLLGASGCAGSDCEGDVETLAACGGDIVAGTDDVWESGPVTGTYLDFHGERTWQLDPSGWMGSRKPYAYEAYLTFQAQPTVDGGPGFAEASGNLAEFQIAQAGSGYALSVLNDSCAQYYLRVVVTYPPAEAGTPTPACLRKSGAAATGATHR